MALALRITRRLLAFSAYGGAMAVLVLILWPLVPRGAGVEAQTANAAETKAPARPAGVPHRIPSWAWDLHAWLLAQPGERGPRPEAAPRHVPAWFWTWRSWRLDLAPAG